jgi:hypothetical protein
MIHLEIIKAGSTIERGDFQSPAGGINRLNSPGKAVHAARQASAPVTSRFDNAGRVDSLVHY